MFVNYQTTWLGATTNTLFSCVFSMHVIIAVTILSLCAKEKKSKKEAEEPNDANLENGDGRKTGGGNERSRPLDSSHSHRHFTPPHIATAAPGPSLLRANNHHNHQQKCPVHCQFSESKTETSEDVHEDSTSWSDIEFDSTQPLSGVDHQQYLAEQCTCFCAAPKRVRFQCPTKTTSSLKSLRHRFI